MLAAETGNYSASGSGVRGQAIFNNQDAYGTRSYQVTFNLPWTTLDTFQPVALSTHKDL